MKKALRGALFCFRTLRDQKLWRIPTASYDLKLSELAFCTGSL